MSKVSRLVLYDALGYLSLSHSFPSIPLSLLPPAVGMAFQEESKINSEILNFLFGVDGDDLTSPWRKMAIVRPTERTCTWTAALARQAKAAVSSLLVS
jgi:hypothetical protein